MTGSVLLWYPPVPSCCSAICWPYLLGIYLSCYHVALMYSSFQSTCLLIKISFIFCQAVILNKNMGCDWPPLFDWQMVCKLYYLYCFLPDRVISRQISKKPAHLIGHPSPTFNLPFWTPRHTHIYLTPLHWSANQRQHVKPQCGRGRKEKEPGAPLTIVLKSTQLKSILGWQSADWNSTCGGTRLWRATRTQGARVCVHTHTRTNTRHRKDL